MSVSGSVGSNMAESVLIGRLAKLSTFFDLLRKSPKDLPHGVRSVLIEPFNKVAIIRIGENLSFNTLFLNPVAGFKFTSKTLL